MSVPKHPMSRLKGTPEARALMAKVASHKKTATPDKPQTGETYDDIIARHASK